MMNSSVQIHGRLLARNTLLNLMGQGLPLVVAVATIPFVLRGLGAERFGILALAWVVLGYFNIFDIGLGRAATKFVAEALGKGEQERVPAIIWTAVSVQATLGVLGGLVLVGIMPLLVGRILNIPQDLVAEARLGFSILAISIPVVLVDSSFRGVLEAAQRFDLVNAVRAPLSAANFVLPLLGAVFAWDLPGILALLVVSRGFALTVDYWLCVRVFPSLKGLPRSYGRELRALVGFGGWVTVSSVVGPILVYLDRFMIGMLVTMPAVTFYSIPYEMVTRLLIIPTSLVATLFPAFSTLVGEGRWERLSALVSRSVKYLFLILGPVVVIMVAYGPEILHLWLGTDFAKEGGLALQILVVGVLISSLAHVPYSLVQALGRPDLTAKFHLAELPLHLLLVWGLVTVWGIAGAALAWSLRVAIDALLLFIAAYRLSLLSPKVFLANRVPQTASLLVLVALLAVGINALITATWLHSLVVVLLFSVVGISVWRFLLDEGDRTQAIKLLRTVGMK